jgi:hypothetical protein
MKILFTGDVSFTGCFVGVEEEATVLSPSICEYFKSHDHVCINLEGPGTKEKLVYGKGDGVVSSPTSIRYLAKAGVTHFNLANNHTFDCGVKGFIETKEIIEELSLNYFGAGVDLEEASSISYIVNQTTKVALIAVGDPGASLMIAKDNEPGVFSDNHVSLIKNKVREAKSNNADFIVLSFHNGTEFNKYPVKYIKDKLKRISAEGVDLIVGHHPHVIQPIEELSGNVIAYSLGNFIFDLCGHDQFTGTRNSLLLSVTFEKGQALKVDYRVTEIDKHKARVGFVPGDKYIKLVAGGLSKSNVDYLTDNLRVIFSGLPLDRSKRIIACCMYPMYLLYRIKSGSKGNARALIDDSLDYLHLGIFKRFIKTKNCLNKSNEF